MLGIRSTSLATYNSAPYDTIFAVPAQAFFQFLFQKVLIFPYFLCREAPKPAFWRQTEQKRGKIMRLTDMADELYTAATDLPGGVRAATAKRGGVTVTRV